MAPFRSKSKIKTLSKRKRSKAKTVSKHASSDSDGNGITIKTLRKSIKLKEKVKKELKYFGLVDLSQTDAELSSHESEGSDNEYQSEKPVSNKISKKERSKHSSRSSIASDSYSHYSFESSDSSVSEKKKKKQSGIKQRPQTQ